MGTLLHRSGLLIVCLLFIFTVPLQAQTVPEPVVIEDIEIRVLRISRAIVYVADERNPDAGPPSTHQEVIEVTLLATNTLGEKIGESVVWGGNTRLGDVPYRSSTIRDLRPGPGGHKVNQIVHVLEFPVNDSLRGETAQLTFYASRVLPGDVLPGDGSIPMVFKFTVDIP